MNSFQLKVAGCLFMVVDHVAEFVPGMPVWMHWIGRLAAPIFIFLCVWSCHYTHNLERYALRLWVAGVAMSFIQAFTGVSNNIFTTFLNIAVLIWIITREEPVKRWCGLGLYVVAQVVSYVALMALSDILPVDWGLPVTTVLAAVTGNLMGLEGGIIYVLLGVVLWMVRERRVTTVAVFVAFCLIYALVSRYAGALHFWLIELAGRTGDEMYFSILNVLEALGFSRFAIGQPMLTVNYQWMMVFAAPFMLAYNRRKGQDIKWFFYVFYPAHILLLWSVGQLLGVGV